jgi:hypothetical protein
VTEKPPLTDPRRILCFAIVPDGAADAGCMGDVMRTLKSLVLILAGVLLLQGCTSRGVQLVKIEGEFQPVPEIDQTFQPIPLKVGVYITPEAARAINYFDARDRGGELLGFGPLGPGLLSGVIENFPRAFSEVSVISSFPDVNLVGEDIDAIVVCESAAASRWWGGQVGMGFVDTLLNVGIYSPRGDRISGYQVIATSRFHVPHETNHQLAMQNVVPFTALAAKDAVRLALHRFPRSVAGQLPKTRQIAGSDVMADREKMFQASVADAMPKPPGKHRDAMEWATTVQRQTVMLSTLSLAVNAQLANTPGANQGLLRLSNRMNQFILTQAASEGRANSQKEYWVEFIGGVSPNVPFKRAAMDIALGASPAERIPAAVCEELGKLSNRCAAGGNSGRCLLYGTAHAARCR